MFNKTSRSDQYCVAARNPIFTISSSSETFCTSSVVSRETNEAIDKGVSLTSKVTWYRWKFRHDDCSNLETIPKRSSSSFFSLTKRTCR